MIRRSHGRAVQEGPGGRTARRFQRRHHRRRRSVGRDGGRRAWSDRGGGVAVGIRTDEDRRRVNPYVSYSKPTGTGQARNLTVVCSGYVVLAVVGEYGTLSEIGLALKIGRPVVALESWNLGVHVVIGVRRRRRLRKPSVLYGSRAEALVISRGSC